MLFKLTKKTALLKLEIKSLQSLIDGFVGLDLYINHGYVPNESDILPGPREALSLAVIVGPILWVFRPVLEETLANVHLHFRPQIQQLEYPDKASV